MVDYLRNFTIKTSKKRKSVAIGGIDGQLVVFGPEFMTKEMARKVLLDNLDVVKTIADKLSTELPKYEEGTLLPYLGDLYPIKYSSNKICFNQAFCIFGETPKVQKKCIETIYKYLAKNYLTQRIQELAYEMNVEYRKVKVTSAKTRWGSCSSTKTISFSWRLIKLRKELVDFVIYHELSHLYVMNHSKDFYNILGQYCPNYRMLDKELRNSSMS